MTAIGNAACLVSWSGSMFEYLMPFLVLRSPEGTLVNQSYRLAVDSQIAYAQRGARPGEPLSPPMPLVISALPISIPVSAFRGSG